jgi:tetratricopeptide (TPR) repeat protein
LDEDQPNLRAAFNCGVQHDVNSALRLIAALGYYWLIRGHLPEAEQACRRALRHPAASRPELRAAALRVSGHISCAFGNYADALSDLEEARSLGGDLGDPSVVAEAVDGLAWVAFEEGRYEDAQHLNEQALGEWSKCRVDHGCVSSVAEVLHNLGILAFERGELEAAANWFHRSLAASANIGLTERIAPLYGLGKIARAEGRLQLAKEMFTESAALAERVGFPRWLAFSLLFLGSIACEQRDLDLSESRLREAMVLSVRLADRICIAWCAETLAATAARRGRLRHAARLLGAAEALRENAGTPVQPSERAAYDETVALTAALDEEELVAEWNAGRLLSLTGILELAERSMAPAPNWKS